MVTERGTTLPRPYDAITKPYDAYPFPAHSTHKPEGPFVIFEFGPRAQYDASQVDSFGINISHSRSVGTSPPTV